jgi:hypothetical protein
MKGKRGRIMNEIEAKVSRLIQLSRKLRQVAYAAPSDALRDALSARADNVYDSGRRYEGSDWTVELTYTVDSERQTGY